MPIKLKGKIVSGLGVGAKYVQLYRGVFNKYLGIDPYPGTLNIDIGQDFFIYTKKLKAKIIPPPRKGLGCVLAYPGILMGIKIYVIKPCITNHGWNILEIISDKNLRKTLNLKDNDIVEIIIYDEEDYSYI